MRIRLPLLRRPGAAAPAETTVLAGVLIAAVVLLGLLAAQAQSAYRSQRDQAREALRHYSSVAAWQFARQTREDLRTVAALTIGEPVSRVLRDRGDWSHVVAFDEIERIPPDTSCECGARPLPVLTYFRYEIATGRLVLDHPEVADAPRLARMLTAELHSARSPFARGVENCELFLDGGDARGPHAISVQYVGAVPVPQRYMYGAISPATAVAPALARVAARTSLLPDALLALAQQDSSVALAVTAGATTLFARERGGWELAATDSLGDGVFGGVVRASLAPAAASRLLVGGLPRSRLPMLALLVALAVALLVIAAVQLARGARFAKMRADFVASVSHELRTPIALVRTHTETLIKDGAVARAEHRRFLDVVLRETNRLGRMVENLLHVSAVERGTVRVCTALTPIGEVVRRAVLDFAPLAAQRGATIDVRADDVVVADVDRAALVQMLFNILGNAVTYGPEGQRIAVSLCRDGDIARLTIDDEGPGIPRAERASVFQRYVRLVNVEQGGPAGGGIGLTIVRELADAQNMAVRIDDAPGGGARIVIDIPLAPRPGADRAAAQPVLHHVDHAEASAP